MKTLNFEDVSFRTSWGHDNENTYERNIVRAVSFYIIQEEADAFLHKATSYIKSVGLSGRILSITQKPVIFPGFQWMFGENWHAHCIAHLSKHLAELDVRTNGSVH